MIKFDFELNKQYNNLLPCDLHGFLHEEKIRPAILVFPGGAYHMVCDREKFPVMDRFYELGYNVFYLNYATADRFPAIRFPAHFAGSFCYPIYQDKRVAIKLFGRSSAMRIFCGRSSFR